MPPTGTRVWPLLWYVACSATVSITDVARTRASLLHPRSTQYPSLILLHHLDAGNPLGLLHTEAVRKPYAQREAVVERDGVAVSKVIAAAYQSAREGKAITIE